MEANNLSQNYPMPRIGDQAPSFEAVTTQGKIRFPEDFSGKWKILFSHPADFTPVCTSEFMTFAARSAEFDALNTQLIGLQWTAFIVTLHGSARSKTKSNIVA